LSDGENGSKDFGTDGVLVKTFKERLAKSRSQSGTEWTPIMGYQQIGGSSGEKNHSISRKRHSECVIGEEEFQPRNSTPKTEHKKSVLWSEFSSSKKHSDPA
jgi:hypothetical protein